MKGLVMKFLPLAIMCLPAMAFAENVTVDTFVRAESDHMFRQNIEAFGVDFGKMVHLRDPVTPENQTVIRMNQDTLYSGAVLDLSEPVEIILPEIDGRYMSMHVINQDHYMYVESAPGTYSITKDDLGTGYAWVAFRTFADVTDPADIKAAHAAQDAITMTGGGAGPFDAPDWNLDNLAVARKALNDIASLGFDTSYAFGREDETRPIDYLVGAAAGWGGLPKVGALYVIDSVAANDGTIAHTVTMGDVPVDAFWSVTVYNADGYIEANDLNVNSYNDVTAKPNADGTVTLNFGGCEDDRANCIPITQGWNYTIRLYQPRAEILDGSWTFPTVEPAG